MLPNFWICLTAMWDDGRGLAWFFTDFSLKLLLGVTLVLLCGFHLQSLRKALLTSGYLEVSSLERA
jgi:hypothetical protein